MLYYSNNHTGHIQYSSNSDRTEYYVDYRFGLGQQKSIGNKWSWAYGFDFTGHNYLSEYNSGDGEEYESTETDKTFTYGGGPFLKISYSLFKNLSCLLYTSDAADERSSVDLGGRRIIKKKQKEKKEKKKIKKIKKTETKHTRDMELSKTQNDDIDEENMTKKKKRNI